MSKMSYTQIYEKVADIVKGPVGHNILDVSPEIDENEGDFQKGVFGYLDPSSGKFKLGCTATSMGMMALYDSGDFGIATDPNKRNVAGGKMLCVVCSGGYEIRTNQFVNDTYHYNDALTVENTGDDKGKLKKGTVYQDNVVAIVSKPPESNEYGVSVITAWTIYLPKHG